MIETIATVESNEELSPGYRLLVLSFERHIEVRAGQFAMLRAKGSVEPLLRRALAVYQQLDRSRLSFLYQVLGRGTESLARCVSGSKIEALLPLGNSWPVDDSTSAAGRAGKVAQTDRAIVVAGGIGSASLLMLCEQLPRQNCESHVLFGSRNAATARGCGVEDFRALGLPLEITSDDGSLGEQGLVTKPLERLLSSADFSRAVIYACGPWVMMSRVADIAARSSVPCLVSLEAPMGCGFGVCVGCVVATRTTGPAGYESYKRVCIDGPIFSAESIDWDVNPMSYS